MLVDALHRISPDEYRRLVEAEVFDEDARVELIDGLIFDMSPKSREHELAIEFLARTMFRGVDDERFRLRIAAPLSLETSEPEPDLAVVPVDAPEPAHPATAALVIEVAVSSQRRDLVEKPPIYARAGIPAYLVIDLDARTAVEHGEPQQGRYTRVRQLGPDEELAALAAVSGARIDLRAVLDHAAR